MNQLVLKKIANILIEVAKKGPGNYITYGELSRKINNCISPRNLNHPLGTLSDIAMDNGFPRISAIVINQNTGMPGEGYFRYYAGGINDDQWEKFWLKDLTLIYNCKNWDEFIKLL